jgi:pimeloyl-ACP methyl ester carboxylesterase
MTIPLLLLPGLLCDARLWRHQAETLSDIADIAIPDLTTDDNIQALAKKVLETAPKRFALAGLSMGGYVAQEIMRQAPERVLRLALVDTTFKADAPEQTERRRALMSLANHGEFKGVTPRLLPILIHADRMNDPTVANVVMEMAENIGKEAFIRQQTAIMNRPDGTGDLPRINCPTLVVCGRQDILTPPGIHVEMAGRISNAKLVVIEDCAHLPPIERPQAMSALFRYWLQD